MSESTRMRVIEVDGLIYGPATIRTAEAEAVIMRIAERTRYLDVSFFEVCIVSFSLLFLGLAPGFEVL